MRRLLILAIAASCAWLCPAQAIIHGSGDPRTLNPVPNCATNRLFVDDSTGKLYQATQGSPCIWSDPTGVLYRLTVPISNTLAGTGENNIASYLMPAGTMSANSIVKIHFYGLGSGGAGTCIFKVHFGTSATATSNVAIATSTTGSANRALETFTTMANSNATNAQTISSIATASTNALTDTGTTSTIDTTVPTYIGFTAQNSVAADNCAVTEVDIQLL